MANMIKEIEEKLKKAKYDASSLPVAVYETENIELNGSRYLKFYLYNSSSSIDELSIVFMVNNLSYTSNRFSVIKKYNNPNVIGCVIKLDDDYKGEDYEIISESFNGKAYVPKKVDINEIKEEKNKDTVKIKKKSKSIWIVLIILLLLGGIGYYLYQYTDIKNVFSGIGGVTNKLNKKDDSSNKKLSEETNAIENTNSSNIPFSEQEALKTIEELQEKEKKEEEEKKKKQIERADYYEQNYSAGITIIDNTFSSAMNGGPFYKYIIDNSEAGNDNRYVLSNLKIEETETTYEISFDCGTNHHALNVNMFSPPTGVYFATLKSLDRGDNNLSFSLNKDKLSLYLKESDSRSVTFNFHRSDTERAFCFFECR